MSVLRLSKLLEANTLASRLNRTRGAMDSQLEKSIVAIEDAKPRTRIVSASNLYERA